MSIEIIAFKTLKELSLALGRCQRPVRFIAGGTDLVMEINSRGFDDCLLVDISRMDELTGIKEAQNQISIGAATCFSALSDHCLIQKNAACLARAAAHVGSVQIRNRGTLGGNIATASPAADGMPALAALDAAAQVMAWDSKGKKKVEMRKISRCGVELQPNQLITRIILPLRGPGWYSGFAKLGHRREVTIAKLNCAMQVEFDSKAMIIRQGRIAMGALAAHPVCPEELSCFLNHRTLDKKIMIDLADQLSAQVAKLIPSRASRPYKQAAVRGLAMDLLDHVFSTVPAWSAIKEE